MFDSLNRENGRRHFQLSYANLDSPLIVQTLLRGEIFECYSTLGYVSREIPSDRIEDQCKLETIVFQKACIARGGLSPEKIPAGIYTSVSRFVLEKSGFLEGSSEQAVLYQQALDYANSPEGRAESLVMSTFPDYDVEKMNYMNYESWTRLVFQAIATQKLLYGVPNAGDFVAATDVEEYKKETEAGVGLTSQDIQKVHKILGFRNGEYGSGSSKVVVTPMITDAGVITAGGGLTRVR